MKLTKARRRLLELVQNWLGKPNRDTWFSMMDLYRLREGDCNVPLLMRRGKAMGGVSASTSRMIRDMVRDGQLREQNDNRYRFQVTEEAWAAFDD